MLMRWWLSWHHVYTFQSFNNSKNVWLMLSLNTSTIHDKLSSEFHHNNSSSHLMTNILHRVERSTIDSSIQNSKCIIWCFSESEMVNVKQFWNVSSKHDLNFECISVVLGWGRGWSSMHNLFEFSRIKWMCNIGNEWNPWEFINYWAPSNVFHK